MRDHDNSWKILVPIWVHFGTIFEHFLGTRRLSNREFERELIFDRFWLDFGPLLGTLLGAMLGQDGPLKLCKVTFFYFLPSPWSLHYSAVFWKGLRTLSRLVWNRLGLDFRRFFEAKMSANIDLDVNARIVFSLKRKSNFEGSECIEKHQKSTSKRLAKHVDKKFPKLVQKCPEIVLVGFKRLPKRCQNLPSTRRTENFEGQRRHGWKQWKKQRKKRGGAIPPPLVTTFFTPCGEGKREGGLQTTRHTNNREHLTRLYDPRGTADYIIWCNIILFYFII